MKKLAVIIDISAILAGGYAFSVWQASEAAGVVAGIVLTIWISKH